MQLPVIVDDDVDIFSSLCIYRAKKLSIPASKFGQVVGRSSNNLTLIRSHTGASIEVEKSSRQAPTRTLIIK